MQRLLVVSILSVVALLGCDDGDGGAEDDPDSPVTAEPGDGQEPPDDGGPVPVGPTPGLDGVMQVAIDSAELVADDKLEVAFYNGILDCYGVDRVEVLETDIEVTVSVFTGSLPAQGDVACIEIAQLQSVSVTLDAPLADRRLIDGSSGADVPLG